MWVILNFYGGERGLQRVWCDFYPLDQVNSLALHADFADFGFFFDILYIFFA